MEPHPNVERIKQEYRAFVEGDFSGLAKLFAEDAVWHVRGSTPLAGDYSGCEAIVDFLRRLALATHHSFMIEVHDIVANDQHTVVLAHTTVKRDDRTYTADEVHVFCTDETGLITEAWGLSSDPAGQGQFWF
ncbi:MAG: nuclear transport factor 2 family protein [Acidimicrobiia bacterium]|nr:nuclear transport factor 2 family protein [Acidimicrobiia bacterium]MDH3397004.1 nuclear transport factor 2 family protein [Acidimicrobiia bacterium]